ncbi:MAG: hypothetical protein WC384_20465 [Prolixibacteraceae bacterium]|jgi:uncharacterized protein YodC (DUF2158 family)
MKIWLYVILMFILAGSLHSCTDRNRKDGDWDDNIKLSTKAVEFSSSRDSVTIKTGGNWWWVSDISVDGTWYYGFSGIDLESDNYSIKEDCFEVERVDKNTLSIKVEANPNASKRIITVGLQAGDYFDRLTITQKPKP